MNNRHKFFRLTSFPHRQKVKSPLSGLISKHVPSAAPFARLTWHQLSVVRRDNRCAVTVYLLICLFTWFVNFWNSVPWLFQTVFCFWRFRIVCFRVLKVKGQLWWGQTSKVVLEGGSIDIFSQFLLWIWINTLLSVLQTSCFYQWRRYLFY